MSGNLEKMRKYMYNISFKLHVVMYYLIIIGVQHGAI